MCDHYEEYYWPYHESCEPDPLDGFGGAPAESFSVTTFAAIDPLAGLHFPPSDEFGYSP